MNPTMGFLSGIRVICMIVYIYIYIHIYALNQRGDLASKSVSFTKIYCWTLQVYWWYKTGRFPKGWDLHFDTLHTSFRCPKDIWLVVFCQPIWKICVSQIGNLPQVSGWKYKNIWNHHLDMFFFRNRWSSSIILIVTMLLDKVLHHLGCMKLPKIMRLTTQLLSMSMMHMIGDDWRIWCIATDWHRSDSISKVCL